MKGWETKKLGEIAAVQMGQSPPGETYNSDGVGLPFFQGKAEFGEEHPIRVKWCSQPSRIAEAGDILLSVRAPVGPTNFATERCCIGRGLAAIRSEPKKCNQRYIRYYLKRFEFDIAARGVGSTFTAINRNDIERLELPVPPLAKQERIVRLLDEADKLRKLRAQADRRTAALIPSLFHEMFGDVDSNYKKWPMVRFAEIGEARLGKMLDAKQQTGKHKRLYLRNANVQWNRLDLGDLLEMDFSEADREEFRLRPSDLLICEGGEVGRAAIWRDELPECYFQKALHRVRLHPAKAIPEFVLHLMQAIATANSFRGYVGSATIPHLTGVKLASIRIPLPPLPLQEEFAARVSEIRAVHAEQAASRRLLDNLFQSLLHRAFKGEL